MRELDLSPDTREKDTREKTPLDLLVGELMEMEVRAAERITTPSGREVENASNLQARIQQLTRDIDWVYREEIRRRLNKERSSDVIPFSRESTSRRAGEVLCGQRRRRGFHRKVL